jgi:hypothetical protein
MCSTRHGSTCFGGDTAAAAVATTPFEDGPESAADISASAAASGDCGSGDAPTAAGRAGCSSASPPPVFDLLSAEPFLLLSQDFSGIFPCCGQRRSDYWQSNKRREGKGTGMDALGCYVGLRPRRKINDGNDATSLFLRVAGFFMSERTMNAKQLPITRCVGYRYRCSPTLNLPPNGHNKSITA